MKTEANEGGRVIDFGKRWWRFVLEDRIRRKVESIGKPGHEIPFKDMSGVQVQLCFLHSAT